MSLLKAHSDYLAGCVILVDTREQTPWEFRDHETRREKLHVGDYSIAGPDGRTFAPGSDESQTITIERKSLDDLVQSLSHGRHRFEREFLRARAYDVTHIYLLIEAAYENIVRHDYRSRMLTKAVMQSLFAWELKYNIHIWQGIDPRWAARVCESILEKFVLMQIREGRDEG